MLRWLGCAVVVLVGIVAVNRVGAAEEKAPPPPPRAEKIRLLIVTGGHGFEHTPFLDIFKSYPDMTCQEVVQPEAAKWMTTAKSADYDVLVWYDMWKEITPADQANLKALLEKGKPLVALHHCVASYGDWPEAIKIIGARYYVTAREGHPQSTFKENTNVKIHVADANHPITRFMKDFEILDEVYKGMGFVPGLKPLLTTDHPDGDPPVAWAHTYGKSPAVYIQSGHGPETYRDANYRRLVGAAIRWAAGQLPDPSNDGFVPLFNGKNLDGWTVVGDPAGFAVKDGILHSDSAKGGQWLRSNRSFGDFILRADWRISKEGNAGIFIRAKAEGYPWETGSEVQITNQYRDPAHCTGSLYGRVSVDPRPDEAPDVWHTFEIRCRGPRIKIFADNLPVVDVDQSKVAAMKDLPLTGYIGLQDSHNPTGWIEYRNILLKELKP